MLAGDTHPGGTTTAALEECSRVKISRLPVQLRDNRKPQEGQSGRAATKSRLASGEGVPLLGQEGNIPPDDLRSPEKKSLWFRLSLMSQSRERLHGRLCGQIP